MPMKSSMQRSLKWNINLHRLKPTADGGLFTFLKSFLICVYEAPLQAGAYETDIQDNKTARWTG